MKGPRPTTSLVPPTSFQFRYLTVGVSGATQTRWRGRTSELYTQRSLEFGQDLGVGDGLAGFIILKHGRLLVDLLCTILLGKTLLHTGLLNRLRETVRKLHRKNTWKIRTFPTEAGIFGGGATSFSRSILAIF